MAIKINKWKSNPEYEEKADLDSLKFIFSQAEKLLKETSASSALIVTRATTLLTLLSGLLVAVSTYSIGYWNKQKELDSLLATSIIGTIIIFLMLVQVIRNLRGQTYCEVGTEPKHLFVDHFFSDEIKNDAERQKELYLTEINAYQGRIDRNQILNARRWKELERSFKYILALPLALILIYSLSELLFF